MNKTGETRRVIEAMVDALNDHRIDDIGEFFAEDFVWRGNWGCGTKHGLAAFQDHWQRPFQAAFSDKVAIDEARLYMGEWGGPACRAQRRVHGVCSHRQAGRDPLHGLLEGAGRQDRREMGVGGLCRGPGPARRGRIAGRGVGGL